jgi:hypothetical protein
VIREHGCQVEDQTTGDCQKNSLTKTLICCWVLKEQEGHVRVPVKYQERATDELGALPGEPMVVPTTSDWGSRALDRQN